MVEKKASMVDITDMAGIMGMVDTEIVVEIYTYTVAVAVAMMTTTVMTIIMMTATTTIMAAVAIN
jgi:hypothetical protein